MKRVLSRVCAGLMVAATLLVAGAAQAQAATIAVGLEIVSSQNVDVNGVTVQRATWGNVKFNGAIVGTYVMRQEFAQAGNANTTTPYPIPLVTISLRLDPPFGARTDTLIMQGTYPSDSSGIVVLGNVTVATGSIAFLRGAQWVTTIGVGDIPLTFTY